MKAKKLQDLPRAVAKYTCLQKPLKWLTVGKRLIYLPNLKSIKFPILYWHAKCIATKASKPPYNYIIYSARTVPAPVRGRKNTTSASTMGETTTCASGIAEGETPPRKLVPVTTTVRSGCKVQRSGPAQYKSERDAATTCNSNHHHHRPVQDQHGCWWSAQCSNHCNLR